MKLDLKDSLQKRLKFAYDTMDNHPKLKSFARKIENTFTGTTKAAMAVMAAPMLAATIKNPTGVEFVNNVKGFLFDNPEMIGGLVQNTVNFVHDHSIPAIMAGLTMIGYDIISKKLNSDQRSHNNPENREEITLTDLDMKRQSINSLTFGQGKKEMPEDFVGYDKEHSTLSAIGSVRKLIAFGAIGLYAVAHICNKGEFADALVGVKSLEKGLGTYGLICLGAMYVPKLPEMIDALDKRFFNKSEKTVEGRLELKNIGSSSTDEEFGHVEQIAIEEVSEIDRAMDAGKLYENNAIFAAMKQKESILKAHSPNPQWVASRQRDEAMQQSTQESRYQHDKDQAVSPA